MVAGVALLAGMFLGLFASAWWQERMALERRRVPRESPIVKRALVNSRERLVLRWLRKTFDEQLVMIKMPVTRFTMPLAEADREQWFSLLSDVYCTFTLATPKGKVIGCVDVPGSKGLSPSNLRLKRKLFARCGVPHWVVQPENLPHSMEIYAAFMTQVDELELAAEALRSGVAPGELERARANLQAALSRRRSAQGGARLHRAGGEDSQFTDSVLCTDWAPDSFAEPLDSRHSELL